MHSSSLLKQMASVLSLIFFGSFLLAQDISGVVTSEGGEPLIGANVLVEGTTTGTVTDIEGKFSLSVTDPRGSILSFSYIGYTTKEVVLNGQSYLEVSLEADYSQLEEVVVVGYGAVKKKDLTGAVSSVDSEDFIKGFNNTPEQLIQGKIAGVQITNGDGTPGGAVRIRIRGTTSIQSNNEPLYIIDGVPIGLGGSSADGVRDNVVETNAVSFLNPDDIETIDVLKGPSAIAIYGSRAANGVVIINTKSGKEGKGYISVDTRISQASPANLVDVLSASEYKGLLNDYGLPINDGGAATNWMEEITRNALIQSHSISAGGGSRNSSYFASLGYIEEEGVIIANQMEKLTGRVKFTQKAIDDRLTFGINLSGANINYQNGQVTPNNGGGSRPGNMGMAVRFNPTQPVFNPDGSYNELEFPSREVWNPVAMSEQPIDDLHEENILANITTDLKVFDFLTAGVNLAYTNNNTERNIYYPIDSQFGAQTRGKAIKRTARNYNNLIETTLNFNKAIGRNTLSALAGYSWQRFFSEGQAAEAEQFITDNFSYNRLQSAGVLSEAPSSFKNSNTLISFFGRVNYNISEKYLLTATVRRDGSSRFGEENKWANFPSAAIAWRVSEEDFLKGLDWLSNLKLRLEYGAVGNQGIGNYLSLETLSATNRQYNMGNGNFVTTVLPDQFANPDLKWETTTTYNVGLDFGFINGRLSGSLDFYTRETSDLLLNFIVPSPTVVSTITDNVGEMVNTGIELGLNTVILEPRNGLGLTVDANIAFNRNEVTNLSGAIFGTDAISYWSLIGPGFVGDNAFQIEVGQPIHSFFAFRYAGMNDNGEELFFDEEGNQVTVGNGNPVSEYIGQAIPKYNWAITPNLTYKNWDLSLYVRGAGGHKIVNNTVASLGQTSWLGSGYNIVDGAITEENTPGTTHEYSDRFIEDASFIRIDNLSLGYTFSTSKAKYISRAKVYAAVRNLALISDYSGPDPEVYSYARGNNGLNGAFGVDYLSYPRPRIYTLGLSITFQ